MADNNQPIEWYLARDGQQHGPVTDVELKKIIELGYLRPTDLVWRQGMSDWAVAEAVLDLRPAAPAPRPAPPDPSAAQGGMASRQAADAATVDAGRRHGPQGASRHSQAPEPSGPAQSRGYGAPGHAGTAQVHAEAQYHGQPGTAHLAREVKPAPTRPSRDSQADDGGAAGPHNQPEGRGFPWRTAAALVMVGILAAGGLALYKAGKLQNLPFLAAPMTSDELPVVSRPVPAVRATPGAPAAPPADTPNLPQPIEQRLKSSPLWKVLQRNFPDWYAERVAEVAKLSSESKSQREIEAALTRSIVELRRSHQNEALAASPARLQAMATAFVDSLQRLSRISTSACYGYISQGEASPAIADLTSPEQRTAIDAQLATIFDAIAEGRQSPAQKETPRREDYDLLSKELGQRGWSAADLQLFTDARALSRAAPEKVCQMVQDWFAAQLAVPDEAVKIRLLGEALKPVVAG
jgi:hypothetical protein